MYLGVYSCAKLSSNPPLGETMNNNIHSYIGDELVNKIKHLSLALGQAESIISSLEQENSRLTNALIALASLSDEYSVLDSEAWSTTVCTE